MRWLSWRRIGESTERFRGEATTAPETPIALAPPRPSKSDGNVRAQWLWPGAIVSVLALSTLALAQEFPRIEGEHRVVVTVDDLPIPSRKIHPTDAEREKITRDLLAVLREHGIQVVAFVVGKNLSGPADERLLDLWLEAGHELGSHTHSHLDYSKTNTDDYVADCETGRTWLGHFLTKRGRSLRFFRFPMLREGDTLPKVDRMREWLAANALRNVPVTIDGQDWSFEAPWVTARQAGDTQRLEKLGRDYQSSLRLEALTYTSDGDELLERKTPQVLLLHANEVGAAQWDSLFTWMKGEGFRFVTVDDVLADPALSSLPRFASRYGGSHWYRIRHERRETRTQEQVRALLARQADAWSQGDLDGFCSAYVDNVVFVSPSGVTRGRQAVLDRYKTRYPNRAAMGTLRLEVQEVRTIWGPEVSLLGDALPGAIHGASVVARWSIERTDGTSASGSTLLVLERAGDTWRIASDASM